MSSFAIKSSVKLSPNEQAALLQKKIAERRKIRLLQVREQEKEFAKKVRDNVHRKKEEERQLLNTHIKEHLIREHKEQLRQLEETLIARRQQVGQAHRDAQTVEQEEQRLQELRLLLSSQQRAMAKKRQALAIQELTENRLRDKAAKENIILTRNQALAIEKERAKSVSSSKKWLNSPSLLIMDLEANASHGLSTRRVQGVEAFASTYFHLPDNLVHREATPNPYELDAIQAAEQALLEEQEQLKQQTVRKDEQEVKAYLRHKHALAQVKLEKEKVTLMKDLSFMAREDRTHRQKVLQHLPANLFQPVQQRIQQQEIQQYELEHAFEKLITRHQPNHDTAEELPTWGGASVMTPPTTNTVDSFSTSRREDSECLMKEDEVSDSTTTTSDCRTKEEKDEEKSSESSSISAIGVPSNKDITSSSQATGVSKLVSMIRAQQEAWNERITSLQSTSKDESTNPQEGDRVNSLSISALSNSQCDSSDNTASALPTNTTTHDISSSVPTTSGHTVPIVSNSAASTGVPSNELTIETIEDTIHEQPEPETTPPPSSVATGPTQYHQPMYYYNNQWYYPYHYTGQPVGIIPSYCPTVPAVHREQLTSNEVHIVTASSSSEPIGVVDPFIPSSPPSLPPTAVIATPPQMISPLPSPSNNDSNLTEDIALHNEGEEISNHIDQPQYQASIRQEERNEFIQSLLMSLQQKQDDITEEKLPSIITLSSSQSTSPSSLLAPVSSCPVPLSSPSPTPPPITRGLSLQEAFKLKKQSFIEKSQNRIKQLREDKTRQQEHEVSTTAAFKPTKLVTFSSPAIIGDKTDSSSIKHTPPSIHKGHSEQSSTTKRTKIPAKEMYSRNSRMYSRLPEVQERMKASQRDKEYAENRERAKKYVQTLRNKVKEKKTKN